jgi:selT/selW/selH-like putative selenoprotein
VEGLLLVPSDGGAFEVKKNGKLVFSKLQSGRFPDDGEVFEILMGRKEPVLT